MQLGRLADKDQDLNPEEVFQFIEAKEARKRSTFKLFDTHAVESTSSSYKKSKSIQKDKSETCGY